MSVATGQFSALESPLFRRRRWRLWCASMSLSMVAHSLFAAAVLYGLVASVFGINRQLGDNRHKSSAPEAVTEGTETPAESDPPMELADLPSEKIALPGAPAGLDPAVYQRLIDLGYQDFKNKTPAELNADLAKLLRPARKISATALADIGRFLGRKKGSYIPRTHYKNQLNPNANFVQSIIIAAKIHQPASGGIGYTIMLEDKEKDRFIFTLEGKPAQTLAVAGPCVKGKPLGAVVAGKYFELKGARIKDIRRWKPAPPKRGSRGSIVTWIDLHNHEVVMTLDKKRYAPFVAEQLRFALHRRGFIDNGTTLHTRSFDYRSATLYKVEDMTAPGGKPRARTTLIDAKGERFISVMEGAAAAQTLKSTKVLQNPVMNRIYQNTLMHLLPGLNKKNNPKSPTTPQPKNKSTP